MSIYRLKRISRSLTGKLRGKPVRGNEADPQYILAEMGIHIPPEIFEKMNEDDLFLGDMALALYFVEQESGEEIINLSGGIDEAFAPAVRQEDGKLLLTVTVSKDEYVFAEYPLQA